MRTVPSHIGPNIVFGTVLFHNGPTISPHRHDPDIILGYEVTMTSWGYLIDRAATLNVNLTNQLSRTPSNHIFSSIRSSRNILISLFTDQPENKLIVDRAGSGTGIRQKSPSQVRIPGRIVLSVWRLLKKELALTSYSFESTFFQVSTVKPVYSSHPIGWPPLYKGHLCEPG